MLLADGATRDIPVVFLTAKVQGPDRAGLTDLGARGVIPKPFDPMTLAGDIEALVGWDG
jgi:two-component system, OmpR family, alkaline phosphatase synthesis response regulator PhoP